MKVLLASGSLLSFDSLIFAFVVGPLMSLRAQRWCLGALLGACDGLAVVIGSALGWNVLGCDAIHKVLPLYAVAYGICCLIATHWNSLRANPRFVFALPVLLSFDNLAYGVGAGPLTSSVAGRATVIGLASFAMAILGFLLSDAIRWSNVRIKQHFTGCALVVAGLGLLFT
jgi:hypothetical protein